MRIDGRTPNANRPLSIQLDVNRYAPGSCIIEVGNTRIHCTASLTRTRPLQRTRRHGAGGPCWPAGRLIPIDPTRRNGLRSIKAKVRRCRPSRATGRCHQRAVRRACLVPHSERRTPNERAAAGSTKADPPIARVNRPYFSTPRSRPTSRADHRRPLRAAPLCPTARPHSHVLCAQQRPRRHGAGGPCRPAGRLIPIDPTRRNGLRSIEAKVRRRRPSRAPLGATSAQCALPVSLSSAAHPTQEPPRV